ncbi:MAG: hypothetical protein AAF547_05590 [Actinomycetota bacterium]
MYPLAFLFVLFLIATQPDGAGDTAGEFAGFLVDLLGALGQFLTGLFEGASDGAATSSTGTTVAVETLTTDGVDTFTHDHGGTVEPHTHTTLGN